MALNLGVKEIISPKTDYIIYRVYNKKENYNIGVYVDDENEFDLSNLRTSKRNLKDLIKLNLNESSCFLTLTFRDDIKNNYEYASKEFFKFIKRLNYILYGSKKSILRYIGVKELTKKGRIHYHMLTFDNEVYQMKACELESIWSLGFVNLKRIDYTDYFVGDKISNYMSKYLINLEKGQLVEKGKKKWFASRNLERVSVKKLDIPQENIGLLLRNGAIKIDTPNGYDILYKKMGGSDDKRKK